ncbi:hypothetical protein [Stenotrophomonas phage RAS14]
MMKQLLEQYFAETLSQENIEALSTTLEESFNAKVTENRNEVMLELSAQFAADREALVESVDTMVKELLAEHIQELEGDINDFRNLEVEYANRLAEAKQVMAESLEKDMSNLVESLDAYVEQRMVAEMTELRESIEEQKKNTLGLRIFEAFRGEIETLVDIESGNESIRAQLAEAKAQLAAKDSLLVESAVTLAKTERALILKDVLAPLHGRPREIMETILLNVETSKLEEAYATFIPRVLSEGVTQNSEKEGSTTAVGSSKVLAEGKDSDGKKSLEEGVTVTGDDEERKQLLKEAAEAEEAEKQTLTESQVASLRKLAGIDF